MVSGSLSSPFRGAFHLSLTVLVHYRSLKIFSLGGWSPQLPTRLHVSRGTQESSHMRSPLPLRDSHPLRSAVPGGLGWLAHAPAGPTTPLALARHWFGLVPVRSPLLRESRLISLRRATEMFQFTHAPFRRYGFTSESSDMTLKGLPHSDSQGSSLGCSSP